VGIGAAIAVGAVIGLALGIVISVSTDLPFAPEVGLVVGALSVLALAPRSPSTSQLSKGRSSGSALEATNRSRAQQPGAIRRSPSGLSDRRQ
jgi:hypothetical protein